MSIILAFILSSCSTHQVVFNKNISHNTRILIISEYSDTLNIDVRGTTIFTNGNREIKNFGSQANQTILNHFETKKHTADFIPYRGDSYLNLQEFDLLENKQKLIKTALDYDCQFILLVTNSNYLWDEFFGEYKGFGLKRKKNFGQQFTYKYVVMSVNLIDLNSFRSVGTLSRLSQTKIHAFPNEKLDELKNQEFDVFKHGFKLLFEGVIDKILLEMQI